MRTTFDGYTSHYHANPLFDQARILDGYMEWATGYVGATTPGRITWVARRNGEIVAFACCSHDGSGGESEGVLYGVHPAHSGGGLYGDLIRHTQAAFRERGFRSMVVSTPQGSSRVTRSSVPLHIPKCPPRPARNVASTIT